MISVAIVKMFQICSSSYGIPFRSRELFLNKLRHLSFMCHLRRITYIWKQFFHALMIKRVKLSLFYNKNPMNYCTLNFMKLRSFLALK